MNLVNNLKQVAVPAGVFLALNLPQVYQSSGALSGFPGVPAGCPSAQTRLLHTVAFFAVTYLINKYHKKGSDNKQMLRYSLYGALMFFILSSPELYSVTDSLVRSVVNVDMGSVGCPNLTGVLVHTLLFALFLVAVKRLH